MKLYWTHTRWTGELRPISKREIEYLAEMAEAFNLRDQVILKFIKVCRLKLDGMTWDQISKRYHRHSTRARQWFWNGRYRAEKWLNTRRLHAESGQYEI